MALLVLKGEVELAIVDLWTELYKKGYFVKVQDNANVAARTIKLRIPNLCIKAYLEKQINWCFSFENPMFIMQSQASLKGSIA